MKYVKVHFGKIEEVYLSRPNWKYENGAPVTEEFLNQNGILKLEEPHYGDALYSERDKSQWVIGPETVTVTYIRLVDEPPVVENPITHKVVLNPESEWVTDNVAGTFNKTYSIVENTPEEVAAFVKSKPVESRDGLLFEKPMASWEYDKVEDLIRKTYWELVEDPERETHPEELYSVTQADPKTWFRTETQIFEKCEFAPLDVETAKNKLLEKVASLRWDFEVGGCKWGEYEVHTDRESQAKISGLYTIINTTSYESFVWKTINGFVNLSRAEALSLCLTVYGFVTSLFAKESEIAEQIKNAKTIEELAVVDSSIMVSFTLEQASYNV